MTGWESSKGPNERTGSPNLQSSSSTILSARRAAGVFPVATVPSSSMVEHPPVKRMVAGSSPASAAPSGVVQLVERRVLVPYVEGSSPSPGTVTTTCGWGGTV